jgi:hypothetical protein
MKRRNYWTPERDEELKRHEAAGLSPRQIAVLLDTTRSAIIGRSNRLRGKLFKSDAERLERQRISAKREKHQAQSNFFASMGAGLAAEQREETTILATIRAALAVGIDRDVVIKRALGAGVGLADVGGFFGLSITQIYQIAGPRPRWQRNKWQRTKPDRQDFDPRLLDAKL